MGRGSSNGFSNLNPVYAQIKGLKTGETARIDFKVKDPDNEGEFIDEGNETGINGVLVGVLDASYKHGDDEVAQAKIILEDEENGEVYFLSFGISMIGVNIINSIAGCNKPGKIDISLWNDKETGYAKVYVRNDGEKTEWAYSWDELKDKITYTEITKKGKKVTERDDWELKQFMLNEVLLTDVAAKLPARGTQTGGSTAPTSTKKNEEMTPSDEEYTDTPDADTDSVEGDDIPF